MKKKNILVYFLFFILLSAGCNNTTGSKSNNNSNANSKSSKDKTIYYIGESTNWRGVYTTKNDAFARHGVFTFTYKKGGNIVFKNLQITVTSPDSNHKTRRTDIYKGASVKIINGPNGVYFNSSNIINVEIDWDNKNKETFVLKKS